jgi:hypothetical protein
VTRRGFIIGLLAVPAAAVAARGNTTGQEVVTLWNRLCLSIQRQNPVLTELDQDLHANHPQRALSVRRAELYDAAIPEADEQAACLKQMRKKEAS